MTDRTGQSAIQSLTVAGVRQTSPPGVGGGSAAMKWNPGHYLLLYPTLSTATYQANITEAAGVANIIGVGLYVYWAETEPTKNNYDWARIDTVFNMAKAAGLRFKITLMNYRSTTNPALLAPPYLASEPNSQGGWFIDAHARLRLDGSGTMDRFMAWMDAIGNRYDSDPKFEGVQTYDSIIQESAVPPGFSYANWKTQALRLIAHGQVAFPTTPFYIGIDWGFQPADFPSLFASMLTNNCGLAGPDSIGRNAGPPFVFPTGMTNGMRALQGGVWNGTAFAQTGIDYRGQIPVSFHTEGAELGGSMNGYPMADHYSFMTTVTEQNHALWLRKTIPHSTSDTAPNTYWDNSLSTSTSPKNTPDIKTYIAAGGHPMITTAPTCYSSVITGG